MILALMSGGQAVAQEFIAAGNDCTEPGLGACCLNGGVCYCQSEIVCDIFGGVWFPGQECEDVICETNCGGNCSPGETLDCFGNCVPISWIGDGYCDDGSYQWDTNNIYLNCEEFGWDGGDCPPGDIPTEPGACCMAQEDCEGICEVLSYADCMSAGGVFLGARTSCLTATCECPPGQIGDCEGNCFPLHWLSDGSCDEGAGYPINGPDHHSYYVSLGCLELACDAGDCIGLCSGACCVGNDCVSYLNVIECSAVGGTFLGSGSECAGVQCSDYLVPTVLSSEVDMPWSGSGGGEYAGEVSASDGLLAVAVTGVVVGGNVYAGVHIYDAEGNFVDRLIHTVPGSNYPKIDVDDGRVVIATDGRVDIYRQDAGFVLEQSIIIQDLSVICVTLSGPHLMVGGHHTQFGSVV
ncbi:MAG: hypothetical protein MK100_07650, partial [Phycisphaerales bacterium]|nr:hypothetical protein [Phycisphaerales bacterium]